MNGIIDIQKRKERIYRPIYPDEVKYLRNNISNRTNQQLLNALNKNRSLENQLTMAVLRWRILDYGLGRFKLIHWTSAQIKYLKREYKRKGNKEIARYLTDHTHTKRAFNVKNIQKKMQLLDIKRTQEQLNNILKRNRKMGCYRCLKTHPLKVTSPDGTIRIWILKGRKLTSVIKINGKFVHHGRWLYIKTYGPVPEGHKVYFRDLDYINVVAENLYACKATGLSKEMYKKAIFLLERRKDSTEDYPEIRRLAKIIYEYQKLL